MIIMEFFEKWYLPVYNTMGVLVEYHHPTFKEDVRMTLDSCTQQWNSKKEIDYNGMHIDAQKLIPEYTSNLALLKKALSSLHHWDSQ